MEMIDSIGSNALTLKENAEQRILIKDFTGARDMILRAQQMFPEFENVSQMLVVCNILCASNLDFPGLGTDWYWVLQLPPSIDAFGITSQYQKLTALVESIKGKFQGTEDAMRLIGEAFSVLSDQSKRSVFDSKRSKSREGIMLLNSGLSPGSETKNVEENAMERVQPSNVFCW